MLEKILFKVQDIKIKFRLWKIGKEKFNIQISFPDGVLYIGLYGIIFKTNSELWEIKQLWRGSDIWYPTNSLIEVNEKYHLI